MDATNVIRCPRCGAIRAETPPGTIALPTFGTALKNARGAAGTCDCGRRHLDDGAPARSDTGPRSDPAHRAGR